MDEDDSSLSDISTYQDGRPVTEHITNDLDNVDKAEAGDPEALEKVKDRFRELFRDSTDEEGLKEVRSNLEEELEFELDSLTRAQQEEEINRYVEEQERRHAETVEWDYESYD